MEVLGNFNRECEYEELLGINDLDNTENYNQPVIKKCWIEGKKKYIRNVDGSAIISKQVFYFKDSSVKERDKINGQYVLDVAYFYDFDGKFIYMEAYL